MTCNICACSLSAIDFEKGSLNENVARMVYSKKFKCQYILITYIELEIIPVKIKISIFLTQSVVKCGQTTIVFLTSEQKKITTFVR